jgi:hypothetical protein
MLNIIYPSPWSLYGSVQLHLDTVTLLEKEFSKLL